jgi:protein-disulfide isomerase
MRAHRLALVLAACSLGLAACHKGGEDRAFDDKVHAYLVAHPEILQEMEIKLQAKAQADTVQRAKMVIRQDRQQIERDPSDYVANPNGKITVTEFYDYRCPHCSNMAPAVISLIHDNPDVRFVFKEFPIFGATSEKAAAGALAVKAAGGDYLGLYHDFMETKAMEDADIDRILKAHGVDPSSLALGPDSPTMAHLTKVKQLAVGLGIEGTPTFIVGDAMIPGEDPEGLKGAVAAARNGKPG